MPPLSLDIPPKVARVIAVCALANSLFWAVRAGPQLVTCQTDQNCVEHSWILVMITANVVLAPVVLLQRLQRCLRLLRFVAAAFLGLWAAALAVTISAQEPAWQVSLRVVAALALLVTSVAVACDHRGGLLAARVIAWWQVPYQFGSVIAFLWAAGQRAEEWLLAALQLSMFALLLPVTSQLELKGSGALRRSGSRLLEDLFLTGAVCGSVVGVGVGWTLDARDGPLTLALRAGLGVGLAITWSLAVRQGPSSPLRTRCLAIPPLRTAAGLGRILAYLLATVGTCALVLPPLLQFREFGFLILAPMAALIAAILVLVLIVLLAQEIWRSRTRVLIADDTGFRIADGRAGRYLAYADCEWGELRRTLWGAELVLRSRGFHLEATLPLLDRAAVLSAARALRRWENVRTQGQTATRPSSAPFARPQGATLGSWIRSIKDRVRSQGRPYQERVPEAETLLRVLDDLQSRSEDRAAAAVALVALHRDSAVVERLREGFVPPLVTAAAVVAGAELPKAEFLNALRFLEVEDRAEALALGKCRPG